MTRGRARSAESIEFARGERATSNEFANTVWQLVRNRQIRRHKFRREYPIPPYTADFCCVELKLILEIDGADHFTVEGRRRDQTRDDYLGRQGYLVVRISGHEVLSELGQFREMIDQQVQNRMREIEPGNPSPPAPLPGVPGRGELAS